jgi:MFS family permease
MGGSVLGGWAQEKTGRRLALAFSSFLSALAVAIMYISYLPADITGRRVAFLMGKFAQGGAIGAVMAACQTYMSEILPPALRGSGMAFFPVFTLLGQLTGALVIYGALDDSNGYALVFGSQWPFSFVPILVAFFIPESPTWYVILCSFMHSANPLPGLSANAKWTRHSKHRRVSIHQASTQSLSSIRS